jgi:hypothetical protein
MIQLRQLTRLTRVALATSLSLWLAGTACIFGCERGHAAPVAQSPKHTASNSHSSSEACGTERQHTCCSKRRAAKNSAARRAQTANHTVVLADKPANSMRPCPMALHGNVLTSQIRTPEVAETQVHSFHSSLTAVQLVRLSQPLPTLNRGGTHILCCVFLI